MPKISKEDQKEYMKQYRKDNLKKIKENRRQYRIDNREHRREYNKQWAKNNPKKVKKYMKQWYKNNREKVKENNEKWRKDNLEYAKQYLENNPEKVKENQKQWYEDNRKRERGKQKQYYINNREKVIKQSREWRKNNPEKMKNFQKEWYKNKYKTDLKFNLNSKIAIAICISLKGNKAGRKWESLTGYNSADLIKRLNNTMPVGHTWQDFLSGELHIDHKIPISAFNFTRPEHADFKRCWALNNLRLLPAKENLIKHNKLDRPFQPALRI
ncbi:hypothetical protein ES705_35575 [subsurface metagenome]